MTYDFALGEMDLAGKCPDCTPPGKGRRGYCDLHRCRGLTKAGKPCKAKVGDGGVYCPAHGCGYRYRGRVGIIPFAVLAGCPEPAASGSRYCDQHGCVVDASLRGGGSVTRAECSWQQSAIGREEA